MACCNYDLGIMIFFLEVELFIEKKHVICLFQAYTSQTVLVYGEQGVHSVHILGKLIKI